MRDISTGTILSVLYASRVSVMQLCKKYFNTYILKLNCRMSDSSVSPWPKKFMLIGQAILHSLSLNNQKISPKQVLYWDKRFIRIKVGIDQNSGYHGNGNVTLGYNGENNVFLFSS